MVALGTASLLLLFGPPRPLWGRIRGCAGLDFRLMAYDQPMSFFFECCATRSGSLTVPFDARCGPWRNTEMAVGSNFLLLAHDKEGGGALDLLVNLSRWT